VNTKRKARKPKNIQAENTGPRKITRKHRKKKQHRGNRENQREDGETDRERG
jgi:hypothetical protein